MYKRQEPCEKPDGSGDGTGGQCMRYQDKHGNEITEGMYLRFEDGLSLIHI